MPGIGAQHADQPRQVAAHQRLAAGQADLVDAQRRGDPDEAGDLLEGEQLALVQEDDFLRHAVGAAEVAAVGDADAQVVVDAAEGVDQVASVNVRHDVAVQRSDYDRRRFTFTFPGWTHSVGAVGPVLLLPDRHQFLEPVDRVAAGLERLGAVRAAHGHGHADLADVQLAQAMDQDDVADRPAAARVGLDLGQLLLGHAGVGLVVEGDRHRGRRSGRGRCRGT